MSPYGVSTPRACIDLMTVLDNASQELRQQARIMQTTAFQGLLLKGEKIIWWGQPAQGLLFTSRDWLQVPFSLMFAGFSVFWEASVLAGANSPTFMKLWGCRSCSSGFISSLGAFSSTLGSAAASPMPSPTSES